MEQKKEWETREGTWSIRRNANKKTDKAPDFIGQLRIEGVLYDISGWTQTAKSGAKWMSGKIKPPFAKDAPAKQLPPADDSEAPF